MDFEVCLYVLPFTLGGIIGIIIGFIEFYKIYKSKNSIVIQRIPGIVQMLVSQSAQFPGSSVGVPIVQFEYNDKKIIKQIILQGDLFVKFKTGDKVIVLFDPTNQKDKVRVEEENTYLKPIGTIITGFIVLLASLYFLFIIIY